MNPTELPSKRIEYIDALRGFSMILVIYFHIPSYCLGNAYLGYNDIIGWFRMPLFFFISGFVFYKPNRIWNSMTIKRIIKQKFITLFIPFIIFMLLYLYVFDYMSFSSFGSDKKGYWFTFVLFEYFALYIGLEALFNRKRTNKGDFCIMTTVLLISITALYYLKYYITYAEELGNWKTFLGLLSFVKFRHFIFFWLGVITRKHFATFVKISDNKYIMAVAIVLFIAIAINPFIYYKLEYLSFVLTGIIGIFIVFTFFRKHETSFSKEKIIGRGLQYVGRRTLDIYLIHYFILPYNLQSIGIWLQQYDSKTCEMIVILPLALWITTLSLILSSIIKTSPFLARYLFAAKK